MFLYTEGILWYLIFADALLYFVLSWTQGKWHTTTTHWVSDHFPLNKGMAIVYVMLVVWLGYVLYRMQLLGFYFQV